MISPSKVESKTLYPLFLILIAALILRCIFLAKQSLWLDELVSWNCSMGSLWRMAVTCDINKPPLYYPLLHYWRALFGASENSLRALSIPPGVASVWLVYLLGIRMFSRPVAYLAAGYQAVAVFQVYFAQEARNYTWLVFFLLLGGLFLWNATEAESRQRRIQYWAAYSASITLALYTHYFAIFFIAGHGLYILFRRRKQLLAASLSTAAALALVAPFLVIFLRSPQAVEAHIKRFPILKPAQAYFAFLFGDSLIPMDDIAVRNLRQTLVHNAVLVTLALISVAVLAYFCLAAWRRWREPMVFALWHATVPVGLALLASQKLSFFDRRYVIPSAPYVYLMIAAAVWEIFLLRKEGAAPAWKTATGLGATGVFCVLLVITLYQYYFADRFGKEQWRDAVAYIEASSSADGKDLLVLDPDYLLMCYRYYGKRDLAVWPLLPRNEREALGSEAVIRDHLRGYHRAWLVYSHNSSDDFLMKLRGMYPQESAREFPLSNRIEVYSFKVD